MHGKDDIEKDLHGRNASSGITTWAVNNRTTAIVLTFLICALGIRAYMVMPKVSFRGGNARGVHRHTVQQQLGGGHRS